jgi:hypothetical protein
LTVSLAALALPTPAAAADRAPAPRPLYPRFDLTYLPRVGGQGVIGIRPAEIAKFATGAEVRQAGQLVLGAYSQLLGGWDLDAAEPPSFGEIEQCVFCLQMQITAPKDGERAAFMLGACTPGLMRTVEPYDWDGLLRKWFPKAARTRHAGRTYLRLRFHPAIPLPPGSEDRLTMAAFTPDDRTLVLGTEDEVKGLLERLAAGKPAPQAPPGWDEVDRDFAALALDNRAAPLVSGRFPDDYVAAKETRALADSVRTLAVGLTVGEQTRMRLVATAWSKRAAQQTVEALRGVFRLIDGKGSADAELDAVEEFGVALARSAAFEQGGRRVSGSLAADGNLVKLLLAFLRGPA